VQPGLFTWRRLVFVALAVVVLFLLLAFGAFKSSSRFRYAQSGPTWSNGTHLFAATTILISLDGFRADFLNRGLTSALNAFIASGVSPKYMLPSFPSVTFPNHFTLVTGLYPESHGIVGNSFWDPEIGAEFFYTDPLRSMDPKWWTAEPLWATAEKQGVRTAVHMWPGSEAHIPPLEPTYLDKFNETEALTTKVARVLELLDLPGDLDDANGLSPDRRPQLIAAYVPNVDSDGHKYGPNSTEIRVAISDVDSMLAILMDGLYDRNLTEIVNVVVVSDHGMATTSNTRLVQLDDLIDLSLVDHIDGWPLRGLRLKDPARDVPILYEQLLKESEKSQSFDVYTLDTMPERYHFTNSKRIAPLWIVPRTGWAIVEKEDFDVVEAQAAGTIYHPMGLHGYDHEHPLMRAIFVARGPAFPHAPNSRVSVFQNTEVYNIVCDSLGIRPHPNNGTLRLPLILEGLHDDEDAPDLEPPQDPPQEARPGNEIKPGHMERPNQGPPVKPGANADNTNADDDNIKADDAPENQPEEADKQNEGNASNWWDAVHDQLEKAKEWAKNVIEKFKGHGKDGQ
jgi:predicted AlkP superfamily pyrophosphatase or phosphodiesterase